MTRTSKQEERRHKCPKKRKKTIHQKTGPKVEAAPKNHENALDGQKTYAFIPKIKGKML